MIANSFEIFMLISGLLFSAFYSGAEAAIMSISPDRVRQLIEEGDGKSGALSFLLHKPSEILITILVGNNLVNIFVASLTTTITQKHFHDNVLSISVGVSTFVILFFGEVLPKTFSRLNSEALAIPALYILRVNYYLFYPIITLFMFVVKAVLGKDVKWASKMITLDDIEYMVNKAEEDKSIDSKQIDLLNSIIEFPTIKVKEIMVPRNKIEAIRRVSAFEDVIKKVRETAHTRYPVYDRSLDDVSGFLHVKDIFYLSPEERSNFDIGRYVKEPFFVYEHMKIQPVFDHMNRNKVHLAMVKDENGVIVGIITLEDIVEEILGEIHDEHDDDDDTKPMAEENAEENALIVTGNTSLRDLSGEYDIDFPIDEDYTTLRGFILHILGDSFPKQGQIIFWEGFSFELTKVVSKEIKEIKIKNTNNDHPLISKSKNPIPDEN